VNNTYCIDMTQQQKDGRVPNLKNKEYQEWTRQWKEEYGGLKGKWKEEHRD